MKKLYDSPELLTVKFEAGDMIAALSGIVIPEGIEDGGDASIEG